MDNFIVSARKYRPATFDTVVGQQHITVTLKNAIKNNQLAQAFLFCGPRGVGKTTCARILAKTINCEHLQDDIEACGECDSCKSFQNGNSFSIHELDAASNNSVDDIRNLIDQVRIPPQTGKYKIYIIDEVHMLSQQAFNAFLKTLEEPPSYAIFILATTEKHKILPTILSRCQIFDFNRIKVADMANHLASIAEKEGVSHDADGLHMIAQKADGGLRDALSMFDQIVSFSNKQVSYQAVIDNLNILDYEYYFRLTDALLNEDASSALLILDEILAHGFEGGHFISGLSSHFRDLLVAKEPATLKLLDTSDTIRQRYLKQSTAISSGVLLSALNIASQCEINYRTSKNQRLQVELALLKMCHLAAAIQLAKNGLATLPAAEGEKKKPHEPIEREIQGTSRQPTAATAQALVQEQPAAQPTPAAQPLSQGAVNRQSSVAPDTQSPVPSPPPPKTRSWGDVKLGTIIPDLNKVFEEKQEVAEADEPELLSGEAREPFDYDQLLKEWHAVADSLKAENKINLFTLMTANAPQLLADFKIGVTVENPIQLDLLNISKIDILNELRIKMRNFAIDLVPIEIANDVVRKPYTAQEKYQAMAAKNPALDVLRKTFNLGLE
ncbi:DNA polymerase III subunit gamma/tau [Parapedobacter indicus]|uniref:DNA polymerase III subunit gamma/tau n=1 Tax=Parapedobacter indicus TaxID=1477437 RepID=A0A1I3EZE6_9SPHI|nr:DNA polymerase III subunit gamma/tau [Parapedobacter indicus]PPL03486.1 DNA polymerase-3 subunit gamma/tau [Parapedobacter indicus]SFI04332.1 DNA polymerase-3 subunit gamma/tau [Parapedobacter indicus]